LRTNGSINHLSQVDPMEIEDRKISVECHIHMEENLWSMDIFEATTLDLEKGVVNDYI